MLIHAAVCDLCNNHLLADHRGLLNGVSLIEAVDAYEFSSERDARKHLCHGCLRKLQRAFALLPVPKPED